MAHAKRKPVARTKQKGRNIHRKTKHHMIPTSRCQTVSDADRKNNLKRISHKIHDRWHRLFTNMTPIEVVECIVRIFAPENYFGNVTLVAEWEGARYDFNLVQPHTFDERIRYIARHDLAAWRVVFGKKRSFFDAVVLVIEAWSPKDYFKEIYIEAQEPNGSKLIYTYPKKQLPV